jgi:hypothetical protein
MTGAVWSVGARRVPVARRPLMLVGVTVRLVGVLMLAYAVPLVYHRLPHPGWFLAVAAVVAIHGLAVLGWWLWRGEIVHATVLSDLPLGAAALFVGPVLAAPGAQPGWTMLAVPYTVFLSYTCGLICRTAPGSVGVGAVWGAAAIAGMISAGRWVSGSALLLLSAYLVIPAVGWGTARLMRRIAGELEAAHSVAVRDAAELAAARERARHQAALHDRVLQTLEMLGRGAEVSSAELRDRVRSQAAWLRGYVETGRADQAAGLSWYLAAAVRAAPPGVVVELNDAGLAAGDNGGGLTARQREVLVDALRAAVVALGRHGPVVVRAESAPGEVLVTALANVAEPVVIDLEDVATAVEAAGGALVVEPTPYVELRMPAGGGPM